jgi:Rad3-related DNA helicase
MAQMDFKSLSDAVSFIANTLTTATAFIALWVFFRKGKEISTAFTLLVNWSFQTTLTDLRGKLDRLNEYNANEAADHSEIRNILQELAGQVRGNRRLKNSAPDLASRLEAFATRPRLAEPAKRAMVAEMREILRNIQVNSMETNVSSGHE